MIGWIKWQDGDKWVEFPIGTINHMSRTHTLHLFSGKIPVVAKCGDEYISNDKETRRLYHKSKLKIGKFTDCQPADRALIEVGFIDNNHRGKV